MVAPAAVAATTIVTGLFASPPPCLCVPNLVLVRGVAWCGATYLLPHLLLLPRRGKGGIREGKLVARTRAGSGIVRGDRPVGPVDFAAQNLVYDIACEASIMGAIPQAILRPQRKACSHRRPSMHDVW